MGAGLGGRVRGRDLDSATELYLAPCIHAVILVEVSASSFHVQNLLFLGALFLLVLLGLTQSYSRTAKCKIVGMIMLLSFKNNVHACLPPSRLLPLALLK